MNLQEWKQAAEAKLAALAGELRAGAPEMLYGALSAATIFPLVEATNQAAGQSDVAALMALGGLASSIGGNLVAGQISRWRNQSVQEIAAEIEAKADVEAEWRAAMDALLREFEAPRVVQAILGEADRDWFVDTLRAELDQIGSGLTIEIDNDGLLLMGDRNVTVEGDVVDSSIVTGERDVVAGRDIDRAVIVSGDNNSVTQIIRQVQVEDGAVDEKALRELVADYLLWVRDRFGTIEMRGIRREGQQVVQLDLETVYVPLEAQGYRRGRPEEIALDQVLQVGKRLIITGGPGCGKTTVLQHVAWTLATAIALDQPELAKEKLGLSLDGDAQIPLPIFVPLSAYAQHRRTAKNEDARARSLAAYISHYLIEKQSGLNLPVTFFEQLLKTGQRVILLLDGLDEVPNEAERIVVREAIENLVTGREQMRLAVTCRTAAHRGRSALGRGFQEIRVNPLDEEHVGALVEQAYRAVYRSDLSTQERKTADLLAGIRDLEAERERRLGREAGRLIDSPLMVRMLLVVHLSERRMPEHRAELYMRATDTMLWPEYGLDEEAANRIGRLVGESHETHRELAQHVAFAMHGRGAQQGREIDEDGLRAILKGEPAFVAYVDDFIGLTRQRSTLLEERMGSYQFIHLAFQEYLAARYLAEVVRSEGGVDAIVAYLLDGPVLDSWWREPVLLVAGYFSLNVPRAARLFVRALAGVETTQGKQDRRAPDVCLAAAELAVIACLEWMGGDADLRRDLAGRLRALFEDRALMNGAQPDMRAAAGNALGMLGDPRDGVGVKDGVPDIAWRLVAGGSFTMGGDWPVDGKPVHQAHVPEFHIAAYPVTNGQYAAFVAATDRQAPQHWSGERPPPRLHNHPVVYVSWDDAMAYCGWLSHVRGELVRPPSEAEWEKAARGQQDRRACPWGDEAPDANRCNFGDNMSGTTPVGIYPAGESPYGCLDMSGNVWEWTVSLYEAYPYDTAEGREDLTASGRRVVRGGAFLFDQFNVRCAARVSRYQDFRGSYVGFRVVRHETARED